MQEKIEESWSFLKATFTPNFSIIAVTKLGCEIVQPRNLVEHAENWTCFARPYCGQDCRRKLYTQILKNRTLVNL